MKQFKKMFIALFLVLAATSFVACSGDDSKSSGGGSGGDTGPGTRPIPDYTTPTASLCAPTTGTAMTFTELAFPSTDEQKRYAQATSGVTINGTSCSTGYYQLISTGDIVDTETFGAIKDINGDVLTEEDGSEYICHNGSGPDHSSILNVSSQLYLVSQMECNNGGVYVAKLNQDTATGALSIDDSAGSMKWVGFDDDFGTYIGCAGVKTDWETHCPSPVFSEATA